VNDGSTDDCKKICDLYALKDKRVKVIHKANGGLISARKAGLIDAIGEFICYVDGDDWIESDYIETLVAEAILSKADIVIAGHKENLEGHIGVLENQIESGVYEGYNLQTQVFPKMLYTGMFSQFGIFSYVWGKLFRKSILFENQMNVDENIFIGEDAACLYPTILKSKSISILSIAKYHYRQRIDSLIKTALKTEIKKIKIFYEYLKSIFANSLLFWSFLFATFLPVFFDFLLKKIIFIIQYLFSSKISCFYLKNIKFWKFLILNTKIGA
jgi:glycosyltransferase involved in cell wall biosynthesis